jgi:polysaccharide pyruvyl transferase WcaK-like protein
MYLITHAFSRNNQGDGLLVDLTLKLLRDAGIQPQQCEILALDADSFADVRVVHQAPGEPRARLSLALAGAAQALLSDSISALTGDRWPIGRVARLASRAEGIVAVGGGYLIADSPVRQAGVLLNHLTQIRAADRSPAPSLYLPQSIGPLRGVSGLLTKRALAQVDRIYVRDDGSLAELQDLAPRRCADLAVLELARNLAPAPRATDGNFTLVARSLPRAGDYAARLGALAEQLPGAHWAVQADTPGRRSDRAFYQDIGVMAHDRLDRLLEDSSPGVVISVRLHGALGPLIAGYPAIHLAYERKGWGAYQDLGLQDYVHDARHFDPQRVAEQARQLQHAPEAMWQRIADAVPALRRQYDDLVGDVRQLFDLAPNTRQVDR